MVIKRWWDQYNAIPWPDSLAIYIGILLPGQDKTGRLMRRTIMRYANLSLVLVFRMICPAVKKRFPSLQHLVDAGILLPGEKASIEMADAKCVLPKWWLPLVWASAIAGRARHIERIPDPFSFKIVIDEINRFRAGCQLLISFDWISIPLVYTQVVTLAVYSYFIASLMGTQFLDPSKGYASHPIDLYIPIFALLQFFFYMGWLLVAESLVNPFGDNDDDFEVNWLIDRNLQISYLIVDDINEHPKLLKDPYWDDIVPPELPYTASSQKRNEPFLGSTKDIQVNESQPFMTRSTVTTKEEQTTKNIEWSNMHGLHFIHTEINTRHVDFRDKESKSILKYIKDRILKRSYSRNIDMKENAVKMSHLLSPTFCDENTEGISVVNFAGPSELPKKKLHNQFGRSPKSEHTSYSTAVNEKNEVKEKSLYLNTPPHSWHGLDGKDKNLKDMFQNYEPISQERLFRRKSDEPMASRRIINEPNMARDFNQDEALIETILEESHLRERTRQIGFNEAPFAVDRTDCANRIDPFKFVEESQGWSVQRDEEVRRTKTVSALKVMQTIREEASKDFVMPTKNTQ